MLETDANLAGLGAVLLQKDERGHLYPVTYASRTLHKHNLWAVKYFTAYLLGHHCLVLTDHAACTSLLNSKNPLLSWLAGQ